MFYGLWVRDSGLCLSDVGWLCGFRGDRGCIEDLLACGQVRQSGRAPLRPASLRAGVEGSIGQRPIVPGAGID